MQYVTSAYTIKLSKASYNLKIHDNLIVLYGDKVESWLFLGVYSDNKFNNKSKYLNSNNWFLMFKNNDKEFYLRDNQFKDSLYNNTYRILYHGVSRYYIPRTTFSYDVTNLINYINTQDELLAQKFLINEKERFGYYDWGVQIFWRTEKCKKLFLARLATLTYTYRGKVFMFLTTNADNVSQRKASQSMYYVLVGFDISPQVLLDRLKEMV